MNLEGGGFGSGKREASNHIDMSEKSEVDVTTHCLVLTSITNRLPMSLIATQTIIPTLTLPFFSIVQALRVV